MNKKQLTAKVWLTYEGIPKDKNDWTEADWKDLHEAMKKTIAAIAARHREPLSQLQAFQKAAELAQKDILL